MGRWGRGVEGLKLAAQCWPAVRKGLWERLGVARFEGNEEFPNKADQNEKNKEGMAKESACPFFLTPLTHCPVRERS